MRNVLSLILGGGRGTRLSPLTLHRSKPAVPVAGKYRLIDIPISNCINSRLNRIYVLTQFLSVSLHRHISNTYKFDPFGRGFVEVLAAQQTNESANWYQGTADAVRQQLRYVAEDPADFVLILSGDQLYRMDFGKLIDTHTKNHADVTIAVIPVPEEQISGLGIVRIDESGRVVSFLEKPKNSTKLGPYFTAPQWMEKHGIISNNRPFLASMGIYLFSRKALLDLLLTKPLATDFGKEVFPRSIGSHRVQSFIFDGYWEDLGTIKAYHEANLALAGDNPPFDFHSPEGVIYTRMRFLPASRVSGARLDRCLISDGCIVLQDTTIENSVVGVRSRIGRGVQLKNTVIIGSDRFETDQERLENVRLSRPDLGVGDFSVIQNALLDKDCRIGRNVKIINEKNIQEAEASTHVIREGIIAIPRGTIIPDGTVI